MKKLKLNAKGPVNARITIPGSKSYTARALVAAALADGTTRLHHVSNSDDSRVMINALKQMGVKIEQAGTTVVVQGWGAKLPSVNTEINVGPAGTPARFLIALCALLPNSDIVISGNAQMNSRPVGPLVEALRSLGADITYLGKEGCPPVRIETNNALFGESVQLDGSISSQFFSALMLIAPALADGLHILVDGPLTSASYVAMTAQTMQQFGAVVDADHGKSYAVSGSYSAQHDYSIEADASGAMNFLGLAAISNGSVTITNLPLTSLQGDMQFVEMLKLMGCDTSGNEREVSVSMSGALRAVNFNMIELPDSGLAAGVVAAFADGATTLTGLSTLKHKETDRLKALSEQLARIGSDSNPTDDAITIKPISKYPDQTPLIATYDDHRVAMAFALVSGRHDIIIEDPHVVSKSFPEFWDTLRECGIEIEELDD